MCNERIKETKERRRLLKSQFPRFKQNDRFWFSPKALQTPSGQIIRVAPPCRLYFKSIHNLLSQGHIEAAKVISDSLITISNQNEKFTLKIKEIFDSEEAPEATLPLSLPESDLESDSELQSQIDEISSRRNLTPPNQKSILQFAATAIKESPIFRDSKKRPSSLPTTPSKHQGSLVKYQVLTPSKRIIDLLQTETVISPVRRSARLEDKNKPILEVFDSLEDIPDNENFGYLPNSTINM